MRLFLKSVFCLYIWILEVRESEEVLEDVSESGLLIEWFSTKNWSCSVLCILALVSFRVEFLGKSLFLGAKSEMSMG